MFGIKVSKEELEKLLTEERGKAELARGLDEEIKGMKVGECFLYKTNEGGENVASFAFTFSHYKNIEVYTRPGKVYVYKTK